MILKRFPSREDAEAWVAAQDPTARHHATKKKSPAQLDREIAAALHGSSGEQSDVMVVTNLKDWDLIEETLALDAESAAFDPTLRWQIGEALDALEDGTTHQGRKVVARARAKDWELLRETLRVDALSKRIPRHEREDLQAALNRLVIKPWPH